MRVIYVHIIGVQLFKAFVNPVFYLAFFKPLSLSVPVKSDLGGYDKLIAARRAFLAICPA